MSTDKCIFSIPVFDPYELEDCESGHESESERTDRLNDEAESESAMQYLQLQIQLRR